MKRIQNANVPASACETDSAKEIKSRNDSKSDPTAGRVSMSLRLRGPSAMLVYPEHFRRKSVNPTPYHNPKENINWFILDQRNWQMM